MCACVRGYLVGIHCIGDPLKLEVDQGHFILVFVNSVYVGVGSGRWLLVSAANCYGIPVVLDHR